MSGVIFGVPAIAMLFNTYGVDTVQGLYCLGAINIAIANMSLCK